jgi:hypothetical protein
MRGRDSPTRRPEYEPLVATCRGRSSRPAEPAPSSPTRRRGRRACPLGGPNPPSGNVEGSKSSWLAPGGTSSTTKISTTSMPGFSTPLEMPVSCAGRRWRDPLVPAGPAGFVVRAASTRVADPDCDSPDKPGCRVGERSRAGPAHLQKAHVLNQRAQGPRPPMREDQASGGGSAHRAQNRRLLLGKLWLGRYTVVGAGRQARGDAGCCRPRWVSPGSSTRAPDRGSGRRTRRPSAASERAAPAV